MKFLAVIFAILVSAHAASVPFFQPIARYEQSLAAAAQNSRIANGHAAGANQFPYQVSVVSTFGGICGGSLISASWVLCAAHCTTFTQHNLRFGSINRLTGGTAQTSTLRMNHPNFNPFNLNNDVSLLLIPTPLTFSPAIQAIRLPTAAQVGTTFLNFQATVSGWGETAPSSGAETLLRWVHLRVISNAQCASVYGTSVVVPHVVCALGYVNPGNTGACGGDSGGPLTVLEAGIRTQIGVVAFAAADGCNIGLPSGFMRTANFVAWVNQQTGIPIRS